MIALYKGVRQTVATMGIVKQTGQTHLGKCTSAGGPFCSLRGSQLNAVVSRSDPLPDMDAQDDYEEETCDFPERETLESHSGPAVSKLSEEHLAELEYYPFSKEGEHYGTV